MLFKNLILKNQQLIVEKFIILDYKSGILKFLKDRKCCQFLKSSYCFREFGDPLHTTQKMDPISQPDEILLFTYIYKLKKIQTFSKKPKCYDKKQTEIQFPTFLHNLAFVSLTFFSSIYYKSNAPIVLHVCCFQAYFYSLIDTIFHLSCTKYTNSVPYKGFSVCLHCF